MIKTIGLQGLWTCDYNQTNHKTNPKWLKKGNPGLIDNKFLVQKRKSSEQNYVIFETVVIPGIGKLKANNWLKTEDCYLKLSQIKVEKSKYPKIKLEGFLIQVHTSNNEHVVEGTLTNEEVTVDCGAVTNGGLIFHNCSNSCLIGKHRNLSSLILLSKYFDIQ